MKTKVKVLFIIGTIIWILIAIDNWYDNGWLDGILFPICIIIWTYFIYDLGYKKSRKDLINKG